MMPFDVFFYTTHYNLPIYPYVEISFVFRFGWKIKDYSVNVSFLLNDGFNNKLFSYANFIGEG